MCNCGSDTTRGRVPFLTDLSHQRRPVKQRAMGETRLLLLVFTICLLLLRCPVEAGSVFFYNTGARPVPDKLNLHLVPHTHDDLGWLQTADQYYIGPDSTREDNLEGSPGVQFILHTIIQELEEDPHRKFSYAETGYFARWWREQSPAKQARVKRLVASGQLEFVNGGWCMHDEATTHYVDMIDQTTLGHRHLKNYFGIVPRNGWQIDPFGHSAVQAYLLTAEAGFDGMFVARIDYQDKQERLDKKALEMIWRGSDTFGASSQIFMDVFQNHYSPPFTFNFEPYDSNLTPVQDDPRLEGYNVHQRVSDLIWQAETQSTVTRTNHVMWTMGDDFAYQTASSWYSAMDRLIHYANLDGRVNVLYSTPTIYLECKHAANETWPLKRGDFFPYADNQESYWTGYFTSRPALKGYVRTLSGYLQAARQLEFLRGRQANTGGFTTDSLEEAMATVQHHDGVAGTERQAVADDYARALYIGSEESKHVINGALEFFTGGVNGTYQQCGLLNVSYCPASEAVMSPDANETAKFLYVVVYNPLAWRRVEYIRIPVTSKNVIVTDSTGNVVESQTLPISNVTRSLRDFYVEANYGVQPADGPLFDLIFKAVVPPLGFASFSIDPTTSLELASGAAVESTVESPGQAETPTETMQIGNGVLALTFSTTGHLFSIFSNETRITHSLTQTNLFYVSDDTNGQLSGAYIFKPFTVTYAVNDSASGDLTFQPYQNNTTDEVNKRATVYNTIVRGPLVEEVWQEFSPWVSQVMRVYKGQSHVEVEFTIGPIPVDDGVGKEVITSFSTSLESSKVFYTDSNGRDFIKRIRDYRDSWSLNVSQPVSSNYYPINLGMFITDNETDFSVLVDRAVGGASLADGQVELMLHRRLLVDDGRGVDAGLNERVCNGDDCEGLTIRGRYFMSMKPKTDAAIWRRTLGQAILSPPLLAFAEATGEPFGEFSALAPNTTLPENVALLTLQELETGYVLLRLAHLYQVNEHPILSQLAIVDLKSLFYGCQIINATETSLTANQAKSDMRKPLQWNVEGENAAGAAQVNLPIRGATFDASALQVELGPMEIRTFLVSLNKI